MYVFYCLCACHCPHRKSWVSSCCGTKRRHTYQKTILHGGSLHICWTASSLLRRWQNAANLYYCKDSQRVIHSISIAWEQSEMDPLRLHSNTQKPTHVPFPRWCWQRWSLISTALAILRPGELLRAPHSASFHSCRRVCLWGMVVSP